MSIPKKHHSRSATVTEYIESLKGSPKFGPQVVCHKTSLPKPSTFKAIPDNISHDLRAYLNSQEITSLYSHQHDALLKIEEGRNIIASTPTASGKSMIYNLPVIESIVSSNSKGHALYLFPLKALAQDQLKTLNLIKSYLDIDTKTQLAAIYDGDTSPYNRKKIRLTPPSIIISNPDMLHLSMLPYHHNWVTFFSNLKYVVLDEVHTYRGVFGSHMSWVLTRLKRIAGYYGANPQFIMLSATVGNPEDLSKKLLSKDTYSLTTSGAPVAKKHMVFINPWDSAAYTASQLLEASIKRGLRAIVYTQSRKLTELISMWTKPRLGELASKLSSYRAGFMPEERREIEEKLVTGELLGVISTSALELGIDIGDLDLCILVGYPGSIMSSWQRGGRVGRGMQESAIIMIAQEDALDQHFMRNPDDFFSRDVESAVLNPFNKKITEKHLHCAAAELPLAETDSCLDHLVCKEALKTLLENSTLLQSADGSEYFASRKYPQRLVSLRGSGTQLTIINDETGQLLGEIDAGKAMKECHPGAVYLHRAETWLVSKLDLLGGEVIVSKGPKVFFTKPMSSKQTEIISHIDNKQSFGCRVNFGEVRVTERITSYQKVHSSTRKIINTIPLDLPEQIIETEGLWLNIPPFIQKKLEDEKYHFMGAIHALEHALISLFPLFVLCDRNDIGGISCPHHEQTDVATIFVFDGHDGGVGLCNEAYTKFDDLILECKSIISGCECENGCPSCIHSPKCGSGNRPIDKAACLKLIEEILLNTSAKETHASNSSGIKLPISPVIKKEPINNFAKGLEALPENFCVFDLETQRSAEEVGGWGRADQMGVSVGVIYDSTLNGFVTYLEDEVDQLINHLMSTELVIGFNNKRFDNLVLSGYSDVNLFSIPTLDILEEISNHLGYRLSLDRVAQATLNTEKTADGLQALKWYKEGKIGEIRKYCEKDVKITRDLFFFGLEQAHFLFTNKAGRLVRLPLQMDKTIFLETAKKR